MIRGGDLELLSPDALRIDDEEAQAGWEPGPGGLSSRIFFDPTARGRLRAECSVCTHACMHVGGLLSILLEQKTDLGLAAPPPELARPADEDRLVAQALEERSRRATYRVALRSEKRGESYCSCPDFKTNTLGTCMHIMKLLSRAKAFPMKIRSMPYRRTRITVHPPKPRTGVSNA